MRFIRQCHWIGGHLLVLVLVPLLANALVLRSEVALGRGRTGLVLHARARRHASLLAWPGTAWPPRGLEWLTVALEQLHYKQ